MEPATPSEVILLDKFRGKITDLDLSQETLSNMSLVRWLRARNHKVHEAEKMFRKHLQWSEDQNMDEVLTFEPLIKIKTLVGKQYRCCGYDYRGCPIIIVDSGVFLSLVNAMKEGYKEDIIRYNLYFFETIGYLMRRQSQLKGLDYLTQYTIIFDLGSAGWKAYTSMEGISTALTLARTLEENYPETIHKAFVINAPKIFSLTWSFIQPILSEKTAGKLRMFGHNKAQWSKAILDIADEDQLPEKFGGILPDDTNILIDGRDCVPRKRGSY